MPPNQAVARFEKVRQQIHDEGTFGNNGYMIYAGSIPTAPMTEFDKAELFLGSRVDGGFHSPTDVVRIISFKPLNGGGERMLDEAFLKRTERTFGDRIHRRPGKPVLYHCLQELVRAGSSGSQLVDAVLNKYDLTTGQLLDSKIKGKALDRAHQLEAEEGTRIL